MKIQIITERELLADDYDIWMDVVNEAGIPVDRKELKRGKVEFSTDQGITKAITSYEIIG